MHIAFGLPSTSETILIILVILLLFGARRLPELARALGRSLSEFRKGRAETDAPDKARDEGSAPDAEKK
jgi:sec-independent protein translocase protein TatA